jgi:hypothetical protein
VEGYNPYLYWLSQSQGFPRQALNTTAFRHGSIQRLRPDFRSETELAPPHAELLLIRGLPGSRKSIMAQVLAQVGYDYFEADMFSMRAGGYCYDKALIRDAHAWCKRQTLETFALGNRVVVSNTFTRLNQMDDYLAMACNVRVLEARGLW